MKEIEKKLRQTTSEYNMGVSHLASSVILIESCLSKLNDLAIYDMYGPFKGRTRIEYFSFSCEGEFSRPIRDDLFINEHSAFIESVNSILRSFKENRLLGPEEEKLVTRTVYTAVMSFAACIDLWKRGSRKTPGTFFEVLVAALLKEFLPDYRFSKHVPLTDLVSEEGTKEDKTSLSTDLVVSSPNGSKAAVIPLKITTRERIVQPFAHQRILDSALGAGKFDSFLACISETQMDHKSRTVKQVCVPGAVKLFKKYVGDVKAIYYCDIPERYNTPDLQSIIPVKEMGAIFNDVKECLASNG